MLTSVKSKERGSSSVGPCVGENDGCLDGARVRGVVVVGEADGGDVDVVAVGDFVGDIVGRFDGGALGLALGDALWDCIGALVGARWVPTRILGERPLGSV